MQELPHMADPRPNFLVFITDQHRADHLSCMGNPVLRTPNIDAIAARGRRYEKFYVSTPICMPNRATLFTGRMPSLHGAHCNGAPLALSANTLTELLRCDGYRTELVGKVHLQNMTGRPAAMERNCPSGLRHPPESHREAWLGLWRDGRYDQENTALWQDNPAHQLDLPYYGFEKVRLCTMHGDVVGGEWRRWAGQMLPDLAALIGPANASPDQRYTVPQGYRTRLPEEYYPTTFVEQHTVAALESCADDRSKPFFLVSSFPDPHHPFTPPGHYWDLYDPDEIMPPSSLAARECPTSPVLDHMRARHLAGGENRQGTTPFIVDAREACEAIALSYGMIAMIDDAVGRIMARLQALDLAENTIVIFMSDHGDFMGDHGLMLKSALHYQGLVRVPFIWSEPGMAAPGHPARALHSTLDFGRTILARAGIAPFWGMQGRDMAPSLADPEAAGHDALLIEEDGHETGMGFSAPVRVRTLMTARHRLSIYDDTDWAELYDLENDPDEMSNLVDDPAHASLRSACFERLSRLMTSLADRSPFPIGRA